MKKMNVLISTLALAMAMITPATSYATEAATATTGFTEDKNNINVSQSYAVSYVVTIPEGTDKLKEGDTFNVSAEAFLKYGSVLTVSINSENDWTLMDAVYAENDAGVAYKMTANGVEVKNDSKILTMNHADKDADVTLTVSEMKEATYAGTYKDTLNFKIGLEEAEPTAGTLVE